MNKINHLPLSRGVVAIVVGLFVLTVFAVAPVQAEEDSKGLMDVKLSVKPDPLVKEVETSIDHLVDVLRTPGTQLDAARIGDMLNFVVATEDPKDISPARRFGGKGILLRSEVNTDLDRILRYFYNPEIPNYLLCPAVLRMSGWHEDSEILTRNKGLWEDLATLDQPVMVRGREFESTTPDSFAEAYYLYDLNRLMVLLKYKGRNVLISVTEQEDKSDVGRKGAILNDKEWDYFYSGLEGLNKGMIGWMDTFTYSSGSVQVYIEGADQASTTVFLFKWLKAGWANMNVVKRSHIYDGTLRYIRSFRTIVESDNLTPEQVVAGMQDVNKLTKADIDGYIKEYAVNFESRFKDNPKLDDSDYAEIIENGGYTEVLDDRARLSIISLEKLKSLLGMPTLINLPATQVAEAQAVESPVEEMTETVESAGEAVVEEGVESAEDTTSIQPETAPES